MILTVSRFYRLLALALLGCVLSGRGESALAAPGEAAQATDDREVRLLDPDNSCQAYCGARGHVDGAAFPRSARRPIRYLDRLKRSTEYRESIAGSP
jgi:hypothetical protein